MLRDTQVDHTVYSFNFFTTAFTKVQKKICFLFTYYHFCFYQNNLQLGRSLIISSGLADIHKCSWFFHESTVLKYCLDCRQKFGLYFVNMSCSRRERMPKKSTQFIQMLATSRRIPELH